MCISVESCSRFVREYGDMEMDLVTSCGNVVDDVTVNDYLNCFVSETKIGDYEWAVFDIECVNYDWLLAQNSWKRYEGTDVYIREIGALSMSKVDDIISDARKRSGSAGSSSGEDDVKEKDVKSFEERTLG